MTLTWVLVYLAAAIAGHALLARLPTRGHSVARFVGVGGGVGLLFSLHLFVSAGATTATFAALAVYAFACELYIFLFTLVGSSIGVKLLLALRGGPLSSERLDALCAPAGMVERRLERMRAVGLLDATDVVSAKGRRLVRVFRALRQFFFPAGEKQAAGEVFSTSPARAVGSPVVARIPFALDVTHTQ